MCAEECCRRATDTYVYVLPSPSSRSVDTSPGMNIISVQAEI